MEEYKYKIGDEVWYYFINRPIKSEVYKIIGGKEKLYKCRFYLQATTFREEELFSTKEELLKSLMTREELIQHEADNYIGHPQDIDEDISVTNERNAFIAGAKWADESPRQKEKLISEACRWLEENIDKDLVIYNNHTWTSKVNFIRHFRKAMEKWTR